MANFETITLKNITVNIEKVFYSDDPEYKVFIDANYSDDVVVEFAELGAKLADILYCKKINDFNQMVEIIDAVYGVKGAYGLYAVPALFKMVKLELPKEELFSVLDGVTSFQAQAIELIKTQEMYWLATSSPYFKRNIFKDYEDEGLFFEWVCSHGEYSNFEDYLMFRKCDINESHNWEMHSYHWSRLIDEDRAEFHVAKDVGYWEKLVEYPYYVLEGKNRLAKNCGNILRRNPVAWGNAVGLPIVKEGELLYSEDYKVIEWMAQFIDEFRDYTRNASKLWKLSDADKYNTAKERIAAFCFYLTGGQELVTGKMQKMVVQEVFRLGIAVRPELTFPGYHGIFDGYLVGQAREIIGDWILNGNMDLYYYVKIAEMCDAAISKMEDVTISTGEMDLWTLPKSDRRNLSIGDITGNCQHIGGAGEMVCIEGWTDAHSINYVFGKKGEDKFHAHMWVWETVNGDYVIDSIEGRNFVDVKQVAYLTTQFVNKMAAKDKKVYLSNTTYGLTKDVVKVMKDNDLCSDKTMVPDLCAHGEYSYADCCPFDGDFAWELYTSDLSIDEIEFKKEENVEAKEGNYMDFGNPEDVYTGDEDYVSEDWDDEYDAFDPNFMPF